MLVASRRTTMANSWASLGTVSSEGGPLLLADARIIPDWSGVGADGTSVDYERACSALDAVPPRDGAFIAVGAGHALVWELGGPGTADVFRKSDVELVLSRGWYEPATFSDETCRALASVPRSGQAKVIGELDVASGTLVILWAPESGACVESTEVPPDGIPTGKLSMGGTALMVAVRPGRYECIHDEVEAAPAEGRRCHLRWLGRGDR
jgi:hypothetical protein